MVQVHLLLWDWDRRKRKLKSSLRYILRSCFLVCLFCCCCCCCFKIKQNLKQIVLFNVLYCLLNWSYSSIFLFCCFASFLIYFLEWIPSVLPAKFFGLPTHIQKRKLTASHTSPRELCQRTLCLKSANWDIAMWNFPDVKFLDNPIRKIFPISPQGEEKGSWKSSSSWMN